MDDLGCNDPTLPVYINRRSATSIRTMAESFLPEGAHECIAQQHEIYLPGNTADQFPYMTCLSSRTFEKHEKFIKKNRGLQQQTKAENMFIQKKTKIWSHTAEFKLLAFSAVTANVYGT